MLIISVRQLWCVVFLDFLSLSSTLTLHITNLVIAVSSIRWACFGSLPGFFFRVVLILLVRLGFGQRLLIFLLNSISISLTEVEMSSDAFVSLCEYSMNGWSDRALVWLCCAVPTSSVSHRGHSLIVSCCCTTVPSSRIRKHHSHLCCCSPLNYPWSIVLGQKVSFLWQLYAYRRDRTWREQGVKREQGEVQEKIRFSWTNR